MTEENRTHLMFRFWTVERFDGKRERRAIWYVHMPSFMPSVEYHVHTPNTHIIEDTSAEVAMYRAGADRLEYRKLSEWEESNPELATPLEH